MSFPIRPTVSGVFPKVIDTSDLGASFWGSVALGNSTQHTFVLLVRDSSVLVVAYLGGGCYEFQGYAHWGYVMEKMGIQFEGDARNIADFINCQMDKAWLPQGKYVSQGSYIERFCEEMTVDPEQI